MELNLRPARVVRRQELSSRRPYLIMAGLCLFALLGVSYAYFDRAGAATEQAVAALDAKVTPLNNFNRKIDTATKDKEAALAKAQPLINVVEEKNFWIRILDDINKRLPADYVWITSLDAAAEAPAAPAPGAPKAPPKPVGKPGPGAPAAAPANPPIRITLRGLYLYNDRQTGVVDDFVQKLKESELYTVDDENLKRSVPNDTEWAFDYEIPLIVKNAISIPVLTAK